MTFEDSLFINESFETAGAVPPELMDAAWAAGWRHFGCHFFRYSLQFDEITAGLQHIRPLRIDLTRHFFSRSQKRVLARNEDVDWEIVPARADAEVQAMFQRHKTRFKANPPGFLSDYLHAGSPATLPCECLELRASVGGGLVAASFLAVGATAASSIYGVFDLDHSRRSLGTLTMLREIEHCRALGLRHYYPGYATLESSAYDYKKRFRALQWLDWRSGEWIDCDGAAMDGPPATDRVI
ncbi:MAG: GNAT family N-acetyltransferase [Verrucomicrobiaceae bacterium]|nr:GNAT family N-acetyltransferase [Verrucomicrobiaceae bacterium]